MSAFTAAERQKYAEIFQARGQVNGYMSGTVARDVLLSSNLPPNRLERIWDLADIDKDGNLDFEEFCIAMHLTFDCINGVEPPMSLPPSMIPPNKTHLAGGVYPQQTGYVGPQQQQQQQQQQPTPGIGYVPPQQTGYTIPPQQTGYVAHQQTGFVAPQQTGYYPQQPQYTGYTPPPAVEFSWDMTPDDMTSYQNIYAKYANDTGKVRFAQMEDFYSTLGLTRNDLTSAWTLVNVNHAQGITQDQCIVFFHILNQRTKGAPTPKQLPPDLYEAFAGEYAADLGQRPGAGTGARKGNNTSMSESARMAERYASRLGAASTSLAAKGSSAKGGKYDEEEMLKRELADLKEQVKQAERRAETAKESSDSYETFASRPLREQFQALYDYKLRQLTDQADVEDKMRKQERDIEAARDAVRRLTRIVDDVRSKKRELETLLDERRMEVQKTLRVLNEERA